MRIFPLLKKKLNIPSVQCKSSLMLIAEYFSLKLGIQGCYGSTCGVLSNTSFSLSSTDFRATIYL